MALALMLLSCGVQSAQAESLRSGIYIMQMSDSDKTVAASSDAKGSRMMLWNYRPTATWEFRHVGNDMYTIRTNASFMGMKGGSGTIDISAANKQDSQKWRLKRVGKYYQIINVKTGKAMELTNGQRTHGSKLQANTPSDSRNQLFCIQKPRAPRYCGEGSDDTSASQAKGKAKRGKAAQSDSPVEDLFNGSQQPDNNKDKMIHNPQ